ncbi:MAG: ABC transporter ATP-binding protein [Candidatus Limnocylindria bacterium]|nr:ABC transporter ATP-binding protein [Candidatus Limnocylindria bacterium]
MIVRVDALRKAYGSRTVLDGISFEIAEGTLTALVGPNGAGKSTLLRCVAGVTPHEGRITRFEGTRAPRGAIAYLPQSPRLPAEATVAEIVVLFAHDRADAAVSFAPDPTRRAGTLSGGEGQRAALAALLAMRPRLLLLDEPTADLDSAARRDLLLALTAARDAGAAVVLTTPAPQAVELVAAADRVLAIEAGRIVADATPAAYLAR